MKRHFSSLIAAFALIALLFTITACSIPTAAGGQVAEAADTTAARPGAALRAGDGRQGPRDTLRCRRSIA